MIIGGAAMPLMNRMVFRLGFQNMLFCKHLLREFANNRFNHISENRCTNALYLILIHNDAYTCSFRANVSLYSDIRGVAVAGVEGEPVTLTEPVTEAIAAAFAAWLQDRKKPNASRHLRVSIGHDSRISAQKLQVLIYACRYLFSPIREKKSQRFVCSREMERLVKECLL